MKKTISIVLFSALGLTAEVANADFIWGTPTNLGPTVKISGALSLDGVDDCALTQHVLNPSDGPFSVFAWIQGGMPGQVVISQLNGDNWLGMDPSWGCLMMELCASGRGGGRLQSETVVTDGAWHHVGLVWDGLYRSLYVDGILVAEDTQQGLSSSVGGLNIGCGMNSEAGTFFSGLIDDVRIHDVALSVEKIEALSQ